MGPLILTWIVLIFSVVVLSTAPGLPNKAENGGEQQPNKPSGPGLWNSIGKSIKTPGEAMPTQIHLPHGLLYDHPAMLDGSQKGDLKRKMMEKENDEALGHEDETIMVRPPWRRPHHYWLMRQEKKRRQKGLKILYRLNVIFQFKKMFAISYGICILE